MDEKEIFEEFVSSVTNALPFCEWTDVDPMNNPEVGRASFTLTEKRHFVLYKKIGYHYFQGIGYVRTILSIRKIAISDSYLDNIYFNLLGKLKKDPTDISGKCKTWLYRIFDLKPEKFVFVIPINHYEYRGDIDLGIIKVVKITDEKILANLDGKDVLHNATKLVELNETNIFAIVKIESFETSHAEELTNQIVEKFIYATKLIDPGSFIRIRKKTMRQTHESILIKSDLGIGSTGYNHNIPIRIIPKTEFYEKFQPDWEKLVRFLYSNSLTDLQEAILTSLYWFGESDIHSDSRTKLLLNYINGLERIILHDNPYGKKKIFGERCSKLFSGGTEEATKFWEEYYEKRNQITHQKLVTVYKEEIDTLMSTLRGLLLHCIEFADKHNSVSDVLKEFDIG